MPPHPPRFSIQAVADFLLPAVPNGFALAPAERRILAAVADVVKQGAPVALSGGQVADNVDAFLVAGRSQRAWRIRLLLYLLEYLPLRETGRRLTSLDPDERSKLIRARFQHAKGLWWIASKARYLVLMGLYGDDSAPAATGFVPPERRDRYADYLFPTGPGIPRQAGVEDEIG